MIDVGADLSISFVCMYVLANAAPFVIQGVIFGERE